MRELHERFVDWLADGTAGDPPRDVAVHASACPECLARATALDELRAINVGDAELPPMLAVHAAEMPRALVAARWVAGVTTFAILIVAVSFLAGNAFGPASQGAGALIASPTPGEDVLGGTPDAETGASPTATATPEESPSPTESPAAAESPVAGGPGVVSPPSGPTVPIGTPRPTPSSSVGPVATPRPSASATAAPSASPSATPAVTPEPTPTPATTTTPTATPTPNPSPTP